MHGGLEFNLLSRRGVLLSYYIVYQPFGLMLVIPISLLLVI